MPADSGASSGPSAGRQLLIRTASAIALAVPAAAALYFGHPYVDLLVGAAAVCIAGEWAALCLGGRLGRSGVASMLVVAAAITVFALLGGAWFLILLACGAILVAASGILLDKGHGFWVALGTVYSALPAAAMLYLYGEGGKGALLVALLIAVVAGTDVGAYFAGRRLGGPRLAPRISPAKTWSGLAGGMILAGAVAGVGLVWLFGKPFWIGFAGGVLLALVAQGGDLFESAVKRRFGAKDSSGLIPGHGGVMDRFDGLVAGAIGMALLKYFLIGKMDAWL